jgi:plasmid stabilization system protein ParE
MKPLRLTIAPIVHSQIREQMFFIARDSIDNALAWEDRVRDAIKGLATFSGYAVDEDASDRLGYTLHRLVFERTYLIHFVIDDAAGVVKVVNFRHAARLPVRGEP